MSFLNFLGDDNRLISFDEFRVILNVLSQIIVLVNAIFIFAYFNQTVLRTFVRLIQL